MRCVNHPDVEVKSFCQSCGKALCVDCVKTTPGGQILCESCATGWQAFQQPFVAPPAGIPNPTTAAFLGLIPGVGAMYNGQLFKGLIHVVVFAVLVSIADNYKIFIMFVFAWVLYQSFEAFHTAKARRDGLPIPDPFGLNELGSWLNLGSFGNRSGVPPTGNAPGATPPPPPPPASGWTGQAQGSSWAGTSWPGPGSGSGGPVSGGSYGASSTGYTQSAAPEPPPYSAPYTSTWSGTEYQPPQPPYSEPFPGSYGPGSIPPIPPVPPVPPNNWQRREPIGAFILIGLGVIFLLQTMGVVQHLFRFTWPLMLIGFGAWLIVRRVGYFKGGSK